MCTRILLEQLERLAWNGKDALESPEWRLSFALDPWTKGLACTLKVTQFPDRQACQKTIVLRRGQEAKLVRNMLQLWVSRPGVRARTAFLDKKVDSATRIGPNVQQFVNCVMAKYKDGDEVARDRAMDALRSAVRKAQSAGLTEHDLKVAWDEGLFNEMLQS
jgi:hypothetical protein